MTEPTPLPQTPSFERVVQTDRIRPGDPVEARLTMDETDRARLATAFGVPGIAMLEGEARAARRAGLIEVEGEVRARMTRECVASLEPMEEAIREDFLVTYTERPAPLPEGETEADLDAPEPIEDGRIDLGAVLIEQVVLAMDPHPRIEGAEAPADPGAGATVTPFDVLKQLQTSREE